MSNFVVVMARPTRVTTKPSVVGAVVPMLSLAAVATWATVATDPAYTAGLQLLVLAHLPVCILEGLVSAATVSYLLKVQPAALGRGAIGPDDNRAG